MSSISSRGTNQLDESELPFWRRLSDPRVSIGILGIVGAIILIGIAASTFSPASAEEVEADYNSAR